MLFPLSNPMGSDVGLLVTFVCFYRLGGVGGFSCISLGIVNYVCV